MTTNVQIECLTCETSFTWTAREQEQYAERGWQKPLRCAKCRELMRRQRESDRRIANFTAADERAGEQSVNAFEDFDRRRR